MDSIDVLIQGYYDALNGLVQYPVYAKYTPSVEPSDCYIVIESTSSTEQPVKNRIDEAITIQVSIYSKSTTIDVDKLAYDVRTKIYSNQRKCLIIVPSNYQTDIDTYNSNTQSFSLFQDENYTNRQLIFNHRFTTFE